MYVSDLKYVCCTYYNVVVGRSDAPPADARLSLCSMSPRTRGVLGNFCCHLLVSLRSIEMSPCTLLLVLLMFATTLSESAPYLHHQQTKTASSTCSCFISSSMETFQKAKSRRRRRCFAKCPVTRMTAEKDDKKEKSTDTQEEEGRRARKKRLQKLQYQRRRDRWTKRYGSLQALQSTFGKGPPWGDLSPQQTRALYHTLLPRSLLALNEMGLMKPEELAPLAYEARIAAKEYARSRCIWTGRVATSLFDQYRSLRDRGRLLKPGSSASISWQELYDKYEGRIVREECEGELKGKGENNNNNKSKKKNFYVKDLTQRIYMRILEKSCATNQAFDSLFLNNDSAEDSNLAAIASQLDNDVRAILLPPKDSSKATKKVEKMKKKQQKALQKEEKRRQNAEKKEEKRTRKRREDEEQEQEERDLLGKGGIAAVDDSDNSAIQEHSQRYEALRILAGARRQFRKDRSL